MAVPAEVELAPRGRGWVIAAVKLAIAAVLVWALFRFGWIRLDDLGDVFQRSWEPAVAALLLAIAFFVGAVRWHVLLRTMGLAVPFRRCCEIYLIGAFTNTFLPGGTGGDLVRAVYIARHVRQGRAGSVASVLIDRVVGLSGLLLVGLLLVALAPEHVVAHPLTRSLFLAIAAAFGAMVVIGVAVVFVFSERAIEGLAANLAAGNAMLRLAGRVLRLIGLFRRDRLRLFGAIGLSLLIAVVIVIATMLLASRFDAGGLGPVDFANAMTLSLLASVVPLTPGGIGIGEGAFAVICHLWEPVPSRLAYGSIFLGWRLINALLGIVGGIAFLTYRRGEPASS